ncbi:MAG: heavy-metal-associated domain-containing protein [Candidatus Baldrarchaeia archaeon]
MKRRVGLKIRGMRCIGCVETIKGALKRIDGVLDVNIDLESGNAVIIFDDEKTSLDALVGVGEIKRLGYDVT